MGPWFGGTGAGAGASANDRIALFLLWAPMAFVAHSGEQTKMERRPSDLYGAALMAIFALRVHQAHSMPLGRG